MTKKRKVCSPSQEGQKDLCADLKDFIVQENAKCVKEIRDSNERRMGALEESLAFSLDALSAISTRQNSADRNISMLQRETAELQLRLRRLEVMEDRRLQNERMVFLVFSGPALRAHDHREDLFGRIQSVLSEYMGRDIDRAQVKAVSKLKSGKVLIEFSSAVSGSERDFFFRSKAKLRGSGLYISESLTPRRQEMFQILLEMKREKRIFKVFTRAGDVMVCRTPDSPPIRVADPEAVGDLCGAAAARRPEQRRAQGAGEGGPRPGAAGGDVLGRPQTGDGPPRLGPVSRDGEWRQRAGEGHGQRTGEDIQMDTSTAGLEIPPQRDLSGAARRVDARDGVGRAWVESRRRQSSSLLDCAGEEVRLVHLSPPLAEFPSAEVESRRSYDSGHAVGEAIVGPGDSVRTAPCRGGSAPVCDRPAARPADSRSLEPPLRPVTSRASSLRTTGPVSEERREVLLGRGPSPVLPSGDQRPGLSASQSEVGGASGESSPLGRVADGLSRAGEREERDVDVDANNMTGPGTRPEGQRGTLPRPFPGGTGRGAKVVSGSRDIREYF